MRLNGADTLGAAKAAVRAALRAGPLSTHLTVHVGPGTYYQHEALRFTGADAGRDGYRVRWSGPGPAGGTDPATAAVVHGGVAVTNGWTRIAPGSMIWAVNVSLLKPPATVPEPSPPPAPPAPAPAPTPVPPVNRTFGHCGSVVVGMQVKSAKSAGQLWTGGIDQCCQACANTTACTAWEYCWLPRSTPQTKCGTPEKPVDCYLGSGAFTLAPSAQRISGVPGNGSRPQYPPPPPPPPPPSIPSAWRFYNLIEAREGAILARLPDFGSGYLKDLGCSDSGSSLHCPPGVLPAGLSADDASVFCNIGADWFTETRVVTGVNSATDPTTLSYTVPSLPDMPAGKDDSRVNDKIYLQGDKTLISEPGEWALEHRTGMLYYWPRNQSAMAAGTAEIVATTTTRVLDFQGAGWGSGDNGAVSGIDISGIVISGSDFAPAYWIWTPTDRGNDTPKELREGMVRFENATDISVSDCALLDAGFSAFWLQGQTQNITVAGNRIERPGFCGVYLQGICPGDTTVDGVGALSHGPIDSIAKSDINHGHTLINNVIYDYGRRVGHGSGFWFYQSGRTEVSHNLVVEGPRDAFGVYGIRLGCMQKTIYGEKLDFWSGLRAIHTRNIEIKYNQVSNVVRDTSDAGALEYWGVGPFNTAHHNCFSDMDPGILKGGWLNFLFQDDAAHYLNFSSNIIYEVKGAGAQETGMIKSIGSVFENNLIADSTMGDLFMITPYLEPAANMIFARNLFVNITTSGARPASAPPSPAGQPIPPRSTANSLIVSVNPGIANATLANSGVGCGGPTPYNSPACPFQNGLQCDCPKWGPYDYGKGCSPSQNPLIGHFPGYGFEKGSPPDFPKLSPSDPVVKQLDYNLYFGVQGHELGGLNQSLKKQGYELHSIDSDPLLQRSAESLVQPWNRSCTDYELAPGSPAFEKLAFRVIDAENIGLLPSYRWDVAEIMRVDATRNRKIQAERYVRMHGLWRTGSSWIGGAEGGCATCHYPFRTNAWARYDHVHVDCGAGCVVQLRFKSALKPDSFSPPNGTGRLLSLSVGEPSATIAKTPTPVFSTEWTLLNLTTTASSFSGTIHGETIFLHLDGECFVDWFRFVPSGA